MNRPSTVRKRKDGTWEARYYVDGERRPRSVYAKTRREAIARRKKILDDLDSGMNANILTLTVGEYLLRWVDGSLTARVRGGRLAQRSLDDYRYRVEKYLIPEIGNLKLKDLTADDLDALYARREDLDARSVLYIHQTIRAALTNAVKKRLVPYNVAKSADAPKQPDARSSNTLTTRQIGQFFEAAREREDRFEALFALAVFSGARPGELLALKWSDLRLEDDGEARIRRAVSTLRKAHGGTTLVLRETTKTGIGRPVFLFPEAVAYMRMRRQKYLEERMLYGSIWEKTWTTRPELEDLVFPSLTGGIMDPQNLRARNFVPILKAAGLPSIRQYDLRHTFATLWLESGENVKVLSEILGHSKITQTLDTYSHVLPHFQKVSYERFAKTLDFTSKEA